MLWVCTGRPTLCPRSRMILQLVTAAAGVRGVDRLHLCVRQLQPPGIWEGPLQTLAGESRTLRMMAPTMIVRRSVFFCPPARKSRQ